MRFLIACLVVGAIGLIVPTRVLPHVIGAGDTKDESVGHGYTRKASQIFFKGQRIDLAGRQDVDRFAKAVGHPLTLCKDVDARSFVALSEEYSKDKNKVYYKWVSPGRFWVVELADADSATFKVFDFNLAKDGQHVWKDDQVIAEADPATAEVIHPHWTWKDRNHVYYQSSVIPGADPTTFRHLDQGFYKDAKRVYWCNDPLSDADPDSFETFGDEISYARDQCHVWSGNSVLEEVHAKSFQLLHNHVYKDAKRVYVGTTALEIMKADAASFVKVAQLQAGRAVLFRDRSSHYVYVPSYNEIYTLEQKADVILIWKPTWRLQANALKPSHAATVSAQLKDGALSEPELTLEPAFKGAKPPTWEKDKLKRLKPVFLEAQKQMAK